jgi:hypothetical protein
MKWSLAIFAIIIIGCTGSLTEEQRQKVKEDMVNHTLRKVSDAEITEAAFEKGREWISKIENLKTDSSRIDSMVDSSEGKVRWVVPGKSNALAVEQQLIDAYISSPPGEVQDNVQKIRGSDGTMGDSILYSKPVVVKRNDGTDVLTGVWNIWLSRKELIMAMDKNN